MNTDLGQDSWGTERIGSPRARVTFQSGIPVSQSSSYKFGMKNSSLIWGGGRDLRPLPSLLCFLSQVLEPELQQLESLVQEERSQIRLLLPCLLVSPLCQAHKGPESGGA